MISIKFKTDKPLMTFLQAFTFVALGYFSGFFSMLLEMISSIFAFLSKHELIQPLSTLLTAALAVTAVMITQARFDKRQRAEHLHEKDLKQEELNHRRLESLFENSSLQKAKLIEFQSEVISLFDSGKTGAGSMEVYELASKWTIWIEDFELQIKISTFNFGEGVSVAQNVEKRGTEIIRQLLKATKVNTDEKDVVLGGIREYRLAITDYQYYILDEIKKL